jgi:hypothetical membrane protein
MNSNNDRKIAGILLFVGAAQFVLAAIITEALDKEYIFAQPMNWLGSGSAGAIFNTSFFLLGILVIISAFFIQRMFSSVHSKFNNRFFWFLMTMTGIGAAGLGIFNESFGDAHIFIVRLFWVFAIAAAVFSYSFQKKPFAYLSVIWGVLILTAVIIFLSTVYISPAINNLGLGRGGMQRMIQYPIFLWLLGFGAHLAGYSSGKTPTDKTQPSTADDTSVIA